MTECPPQDEHSSDEPLVPIQHLSLAANSGNSNDSNKMGEDEEGDEDEPVLVKPRRSGRAHKEVQRFKAGAGRAGGVAAASATASAENSRPSSPKQQQPASMAPAASPKVRLSF